MKLLAFSFLTLLGILSCHNEYLIKYSVLSDQGRFEVLYSDNIEEIAEYGWDKDGYGSDIFIYVKPMETNQILDVRVMYIDDGPLRLYRREVGEGPILIKGKL